jgi:hypothetical protein
VASIANKLAGGLARIDGGSKQPKHQIVTEKIRGLGMTFGGEELLRETVGQLVETARQNP